MRYNLLYIIKKKGKIYGGVIISEKLKMVTYIAVNGKYNKLCVIYFMKGKKMWKYFKD